MALKIPVALKGLDYYYCFSHIFSCLFTIKMVSNVPTNKTKKSDA